MLVFVRHNDDGGNGGGGGGDCGFRMFHFFVIFALPTLLMSVSSRAPQAERSTRFLYSKATYIDENLWRLRPLFQELHMSAFIGRGISERGLYDAKCENVDNPPIRFSFFVYMLGTVALMRPDTLC